MVAWIQQLAEKKELFRFWIYFRFADGLEVDGEKKKIINNAAISWVWAIRWIVVQFTEMMESKEGRWVISLSLNLDQKEMSLDKKYMNLEIRGEVKARKSSTCRYLGFKNHTLGEISIRTEGRKNKRAWDWALNGRGLCLRAQEEKMSKEERNNTVSNAAEQLTSGKRSDCWIWQHENLWHEPFPWGRGERTDPYPHPN